MTLGPPQVKQLLQDRDRCLVEALETMIDQQLMDKYEGNCTIAVHLGQDTKMPKQFMLDELFARYRQAGWGSVTYKNDNQAHGNYIEFQERNNQNQRGYR